MTLRMISSLSTIALLAACGGGETGPDTVSFAPVTVENGDNFSVETRTNGANRQVFVGNSAPLALLTPNSDKNQTVFRSFTNSIDTRQLYEADSDFGTVSVYATTNVAGATTAGASAESFGGIRPESGSASYSGEYVGFLTRNDTQSVIVGTVNLDADFGSNAIDGSITGRERFLTSDGTKAGDMLDVDLGSHSLLNGARGPGGIATGGALGRTTVYVPESPVAGSWNVVLGGDNAAAAGGTVQIEHDYFNADFVENGGFAAIKD